MGCNCTEIEIKCGCNTKPCCKQTDCSCPVRIGSDCWTYTGDTLECSGIEKDTVGTELIQQLDAFICTKFNDVQNFFSLVNIGGGAESYKGINLMGQKELRTFTKTGDLIVITENDDDIEISIDEAELNTFIEGNQKTYTVDNLSDGIEVYRDSTIVSDNTQFNLRTIKSDTLQIMLDEVDGDVIRIETGENLEGVRDFIVDTRYTGDEELGTVVKPYKNLDNAIIAYVGSGSRVTPEFNGSRIICIGGQSHNFTEDLSINNLILEIQIGTTIRYTGDDEYPIDFRTLQTTMGGYGSQTSSINIKLQGGGTFISNNLIAFVVNSGNTVLDANRYSNLLFIDGNTIISFYKIDEFVSGITRSNATPWVSNDSSQTLFYFGTVNEGVIVSQGQSVVSSLTDNSNQLNVNIQNTFIVSLTQQVIEINSGFVNLKNVTLTNNYQASGTSYIIADNSALIGSVLTEDPLLSNTLPTFKEDLCLVELNGYASLVISNSTLSTGFEIDESESWYKINSSNSTLVITDSNTKDISGGILADSFIKTGSNEPYIEIADTRVLRSLKTSGNFIDTSVDPYINVVIKDNFIVSPITENIDLTSGNIRSVTNQFANKIKESLVVYPSRENAAVNGLGSGDIFIRQTTVSAGSFVVGESYRVLTIGSTDFTAIGAASNTVGLNFTATGIGSGTGTGTSYRRDIVI